MNRIDTCIIKYTIKAHEHSFREGHCFWEHRLAQNTDMQDNYNTSVSEIK